MENQRLSQETSSLGGDTLQTQESSGNHPRIDLLPDSEIQTTVGQIALALQVDQADGNMDQPTIN